MVDYLSVTELSGSYVSQEQIDRICNCYYWAGKYCHNKDVLEVACGTGQGLGYLSKIAKSLNAGDHSEKILENVGEHYSNKITLKQFDTQNMPYKDNSMDVIIFFEAIYCLPSTERFVSEYRRVLRDGGKVLIAAANKDLQLSFTAILLLILFLEIKTFSPCKKWVVKFSLVTKTLEGKKIIKKTDFWSFNQDAC